MAKQRKGHPKVPKGENESKAIIRNSLAGERSIWVGSGRIVWWGNGLGRRKSGRLGQRQLREDLDLIVHSLSSRIYHLDTKQSVQQKPRSVRSGVSEARLGGTNLSQGDHHLYRTWVSHCHHRRCRERDGSATVGWGSEAIRLRGRIGL